MANMFRSARRVACVAAIIFLASPLVVPNHLRSKLDMQVCVTALSNYLTAATSTPGAIPDLSDPTMVRLGGLYLEAGCRGGPLLSGMHALRVGGIVVRTP